MLKFTSAVSLVASIALLEGTEAIHQNHQWRFDRVANTKYRLERAYGRGLVNLLDEHGRVVPERLGWTNPNGQKLGANLNVQVAPGLIIDATSVTAYALGIINGFQYKGLSRAESEALPGADVELTNCFASTYSLIETFDTAAYNIKTFAKESGTLKIFDVIALDPLHILADFSVEWQMCDVNGLLDQVKSMASLDYAAMANHLGREALVLALDLPKDLKKIKTLKSAFKCATNKVTKSDKDEPEEDVEEEKTEEEEEEDFWSVFKSDADYSQLSVADVTDCIEGFDRWSVGQIAGEFMTKFFARQLKPVV